MEKQQTANDAIEKFLLRINKELKEKAANKAKSENRSLNQHIVNLLQTDLK